MKKALFGITIVASVMASVNANAALITFDDLIAGVTSYAYDGDSDGVDDVVFSTTDPSGFNTVGPGTNQLFIDQPGIEGTTVLNPDLRVDFIFGATDSFQFGFANNTSSALVDGVTFSVFDEASSLLASTSVLSDFTLPDGINPSSFPEALVDLSFSGIAAYATFDFSEVTTSRYIIDNFGGTFGSTEGEVPVPVPATLALLGLGLAGLGWSKRKKA